MLGRRDEPTDGVYDYCGSLTTACQSLGSSVHALQVRWLEGGWLRASLRLVRNLQMRVPCWVVVQVTHLAWSRHGFPFGLLMVALAARFSGARVAAIIHDPLGFPGDRLILRVKRASQHLTLRFMRQVTSHMFVTLPPAQIPWIGNGRNGDITFLPVGSNIPVNGKNGAAPTDRRFTVVVFGVTEGSCGITERRTVTTTLERVAEVVGPVVLWAFGRGTDPTQGAWSHPSREVEIHSLGIVDEPTASNVLAEADAMLFLRGSISSRRTSAIAGLAHGLPVVGYRGLETGWPVTEAGVVLVDPGDVDGLAAALVRVATDPSHRNDLRARSSDAYLRYFAWDVIARAFLETLASAR